MATFIRVEVIACIWHAEELRLGEVVATHGREEIDDILRRYAALLGDRRHKHRQPLVYYCLVEFEFIFAQV